MQGEFLFTVRRLRDGGRPAAGFKYYLDAWRLTHKFYTADVLKFEFRRPFSRLSDGSRIVRRST